MNYARLLFILLSSSSLLQSMDRAALDHEMQISPSGLISKSMNNVHGSVLDLKSMNDVNNKIVSENLLVIKAYSTYCPPCLEMAAPYTKIATELKQHACFTSVNVDEIVDFANTFACHTVPTLIIFKNGRMISKVSGIVSEEILRMIIISCTEGAHSLLNSQENLLKLIRLALNQGALCDLKRLLENTSLKEITADTIIDNNLNGLHYIYCLINCGMNEEEKKNQFMKLCYWTSKIGITDTQKIELLTKLQETLQMAEMLHSLLQTALLPRNT